MPGLWARSSRTASAWLAAAIACRALRPNPAGGRESEGGRSKGGGSSPPNGGSSAKFSDADACAGATATRAAISK